MFYLTGPMSLSSLPKITITVITTLFGLGYTKTGDQSQYIVLKNHLAEHNLNFCLCIKHMQESKQVMCVYACVSVCNTLIICTEGGLYSVCPARRYGESSTS